LKKTGTVIPRKTIYRLSIYLRCLARLRENGIGTVSSEALAKAAGVKSTQLRKDLAYFGTFGTRGLGYDVAELSKKIADELGTSRLQPVILVGAGHLGLALLSYRGFGKEGFEIVAAFDADPAPPSRQKSRPADPGDEQTRGICPSAPHQNVHPDGACRRGPGSREPARGCRCHGHFELCAHRPFRTGRNHGEQCQPGHRTRKPELFYSGMTGD
jgi:hypothetical protein